MPNPRMQWLDDKRKHFAEERMAHYRDHPKAALIEGIKKQIAAGTSVPISDVLEHLSICNGRVISLVREYKEKWGWETPQRGDYIIAEQECGDTRAGTAIILDVFRYPRIHKRTAGAPVYSPELFLALDADVGRAYIKTHKACGGEKAAHECHVHSTVGSIDQALARIVESIPWGIGAISEQFADIRSKGNARVQAVTARVLLEINKRTNPVVPLFVTWGERGSDGKYRDIDVAVCDGVQEDQFIMKMRQNYQWLWAMAQEYGITPEDQYAHTTILYDPYRLGRLNNPRLIFDQLPNTTFCPTANFNLSVLLESGLP
ncbi:hypothetical protein HZC07_00580, partial [Candidatus Micrarchaeota archaeon]|nr:hypothetical protein [Candidatus Micrarchaeota archaeon]